MKSARVRASLSMSRVMPMAAATFISAENQVKLHNNCG
jgi:hypothetical protein